jgi:hypothetical protein
MSLPESGPRRSPRPRATVRALTLAGSVAAIALAGCASVTAPTRPPAAAQTGSTAASAPTGTSTTSRSQQAPKQRAQAQAASMLKAFTAPPGARQVATSPVPSSPLSKSPAGGGPSDVDVVILSTWWLVPGDPQQLLDWEAKRIRPPFHRNGWVGLGEGIWSNDYGLDPVAGLFDYRQLNVSATAAGHGQTAIRLDARVDWIPLRRAGDTVPPAATVAVLTKTNTAGGKPPVLATKTLTSPQQVAKLAAYLDGLPVNPPGATYGCPASTGGGMIIAFRTRPSGPDLATATTTLRGCSFLAYAMPGQPETSLAGPEAGQNLLAEVNRVAGLHWTLSLP